MLTLGPGDRSSNTPIRRPVRVHRREPKAALRISTRRQIRLAYGHFVVINLVKYNFILFTFRDRFDRTCVVPFFFLFLPT